MARNIAQRALEGLKGPRRLTLAGLWFERLLQAFWPLLALTLAVFALFSFGLGRWSFAPWLGLAALLGAAIWGFAKLRRPSQAEAWARLDADLKGRPIAALQEAQALGLEDATSKALWKAHIGLMASRAITVRAKLPALRFDRYGLTLSAMTAAVMALIFGEPSKLLDPPRDLDLTQTAMGPAWEGWARPPAYTGKPMIYLNNSTGEEITLPEGSRIQLRYYGEGDISLSQNLSQTEPSTANGLTELIVDQSGDLEIKGPNGRQWSIYALPDFAPEIEVSGDMGREANGRFKQPYAARDDYAVTGAKVEISLDVTKVTRHHGLQIEPEYIAPVTLDLPLPVRGKRDEIIAAFSDDLSKSILSNMPVSLVFSAQDGSQQVGRSLPHEIILPGKRFFDPMANALIEMRRDILWNRENAPRVSEILKAVQHRPDDFSRSHNAAKRLRVLIRDLDALLSLGPLTDVKRDEIAEELWMIALKFEEGDLASAHQRLMRAQDRLEEAIRNGASPEEIDQLMKEVQQAMRDYTRELAKQSQNDPQAPSEGGQEITKDQLQQMLDEIARLMKEGKTAEAMALMEQLRELMENLQVQQGQGQAEGEGDNPMQELGDTLKGQQELSDDAYRDMQRGRRGEGAPDPNDLADRQKSLREELQELQRGDLPGDGLEEGEAGRDNLDSAEEAMRRAEEALKEGDLSGALDSQAEAIEAMREGMRDFARAQGPQGPEGGKSSKSDQADPLGREPNGGARIGSDSNLAENAPDQRAQTLLDEIRRRSGEVQRPDVELDYLKRLLDLF